MVWLNISVDDNALLTQQETNMSSGDSNAEHIFLRFMVFRPGHPSLSRLTPGWPRAQDESMVSYERRVRRSGRTVC